MTSYRTRITVSDRDCSGLVPCAHTLKHATCTTTHGMSSQYDFPANPDDSIGSQGNLQFTISEGPNTYSFQIAFVCNNALQNSVVVTYPVGHYVVDIVPTAEVIKTMAPLDVHITLAKK